MDVSRPVGNVLQFLFWTMVGVFYLDQNGRGMARTMTWLEGYHHCSPRRSLPSPNNTNITSIRHPVWTFGLVVTRIYSDGQRLVTIMSNPTNKQAWVCCTQESSNVCGKVVDTPPCNYSQANDTCYGRNQPLFHIQGDSAYNNFKSTNWIGFTYWAGHVNVSSIFAACFKLPLGKIRRNGSPVSAILTVRNLSSQCIVAYNGVLMVDDCDKKHPVICVEEEAMPTFYLHHLNETERFPAYKPTASTPSAGTTTKHSDSSLQPTTGKGTPSSGPTPDRNLTNNVTNQQGNQDLTFTPDVVYTIVGVGAFLVICMFIIALCCCCRRKREKSSDTVVFDAYSEAPDSIVFKEKDDHTVYAVPDDAINMKKAKPRSSISEDEYDVLKMDSETAKQPHTGNVYSHITLGPKKNKTATTDVIDDTYDVTNNKGCGTTRNDVGNDTYEHLETPKR